MSRNSYLDRLVELRQRCTFERADFDEPNRRGPSSEKFNAMVRQATKAYREAWILPVLDELIKAAQQGRGPKLRSRQRAVLCCLCEEEETYNGSGVCTNCESAWKLGRETRAMQEQEEAAANIEQAAVYPGPLFPVAPANPDLHQRYDLGRHVWQMLLDLAGARVNGGGGIWPEADVTPFGSGDFHSRRSYLFPKGQAQKAADFYLALVQLLWYVREEGRRDGSNLLAKLADGRLTVDEVQDRSVRARRDT